VNTATRNAVPVREANKSVPPAVDEIILGLLNKNPANRRPATARELAEALEAIAARNGWKWTVPKMVAGEASGVDPERATVALPYST
jgi:hypothetical protein